MRLMLLGGGGYIGRNIANSARACGHDVRIAARGAAEPDVTLDLADRQAVKASLAAHAPDVIFHLACGLIPSSSREAYLAERAGLGAAIWDVIDTATATGALLVYVSSGGAIYGPHTGPIGEDSRCAPVSYYGLAKLETEQAIGMAASAAGLRALILRPSNVYGRRENLSGPQGLVAAMLGAVRDHRPLDIWGDGSVIRDYLYIDDLCHAALALIEARATGTFNVGAGTGHSVIEVAQTVQQVTGRAPILNHLPGRGSDVPSAILDVTRLRQAGAWQSRPLAEGIAAYARQTGLA